MRRKVLAMAFVSLFLGCLGLYTNREVLPVWRVLNGQERAIAIVNSRPILCKDVLVYQQVEALIANKDLSLNQAFNKYVVLDLLYREAKKKNLKLPQSFATFVRDSVNQERDRLEKNILRAKLLQLKLKELDLTEDEFWHYVALYRTKQAYVLTLRQSLYPDFVEPSKREEHDKLVNQKFARLAETLTNDSSIKIIDRRFRLEK